MNSPTAIAELDKSSRHNGNRCRECSQFSVSLLLCLSQVVCLCRKVHRCKNLLVHLERAFYSSAFFAEWTIVEHPRSLQCMPNPNSWFTVNRLESAGLSAGNDDRLIFASPECLRLWTALDEMDRGVVVEGSPGVGKSISVWTWTCYQATSLEKRVVWIQ